MLQPFGKNLWACAMHRTKNKFGKKVRFSNVVAQFSVMIEHILYHEAKVVRCPSQKETGEQVAVNRKNWRTSPPRVALNVGQVSTLCQFYSSWDKLRCPSTATTYSRLPFPFKKFLSKSQDFMKENGAGLSRPASKILFSVKRTCAYVCVCLRLKTVLKHRTASPN